MFCITCQKDVDGNPHVYEETGYGGAYWHNGVIVQSPPPELTEEVWDNIFENEPSPEEIENSNQDLM